MSWDELKKVVSYLEAPKDAVSLLGGEPTLHTEFVEMVKWIVDQGFPVKLFTNGCTKKLRSISDLCQTNQIKIVLNLNMPDTYNEKEWEQIELNCSTLGSNIALSYNVFEPDFTWEHTKEAILKWNLCNHVRVGMTQPIKGMDNAYLLEEDMAKASTRLVAMAEDMAEHGIKLGFDCGFRPCSFTDEQLAILAECGTQFAFVCNPILDIGPDLMVWRCFPFSVEEGVKLTDFNSFVEIEDYFSAKWQSTQKIGNTDNCPSCENLVSESCAGGCLSRTFVRSDFLKTVRL